MPRFEAKKVEKREAVQQAMRDVAQNGDQRMSWAAFCKTVSRGWTNPDTVKQYMKNHYMSLKPAWVDDPVERSGANGPFGISGALRNLTADNCVKVDGDVALSCLGKSTSIRLANGDTATAKRFQVSDYGSMEEAKEAALKHTQHVAAYTSYYSDDPMAKKIREPVKEDGSGGRGYVDKTEQRHGHLAGDDGVYTDPRTGRIYTLDAQRHPVYHEDVASARIVADAQPKRRARRAREQNAQTFLLTGDASKLPYDPRAARKLEDARSLYGPNASLDNEGNVVIPDPSPRSEDDAAPAPAPAPAQPRRERAAVSRGQEDDDGDEDLPAAAAPARGRGRGRRRRGAAGSRGARGTGATAARVPRLRRPPKELRDATTLWNRRLRMVVRNFTPAQCPAHVYQQLGLINEYRPTLERLLKIARKAARTFTGGQWVVDDALVLTGTYELLRREKTVLRDAFERIYDASLANDAWLDAVVEWHGLVSVGLTTGYVASSLAVAPLPIGKLLQDKPYWEADKLYFSRVGVRLPVNELSTRAQNWAGGREADAFVDNRLGRGDGDVIGGVVDDGDAMEEDDDDVRRHLTLLRGELAALEQRSVAIKADIQRLAARLGETEIEGE